MIAKSITLGDMEASTDYLQAKSETTYDVLFSKVTTRSFLIPK